MTPSPFTGCAILARPDLGLVTQAERRGDMAVVHTDRGVTYICSVKEPHPQVDRPCDCGDEPA